MSRPADGQKSVSDTPGAADQGIPISLVVVGEDTGLTYWRCECGQYNPGFCMQCARCRTLKPERS